jgi:hypothetical protein
MNAAHPADKRLSGAQFAERASAVMAPLVRDFKYCVGPSSEQPLGPFSIAAENSLRFVIPCEQANDQIPTFTS